MHYQLAHLSGLRKSDNCRNDEWNSDPPQEEERQDDGPAGLDPNGVIDSNWEEVEGRAVVSILIDIFPSRSVRTSMT